MSKVIEIQEIYNKRNIQIYIYIKFISNPVRITGNLYSSPCVIEEYVCEQLLTLTQESRGKHKETLKDRGKIDEKKLSLGRKQGSPK